MRNSREVDCYLTNIVSSRATFARHGSKVFTINNLRRLCSRPGRVLSVCLVLSLVHVPSRSHRAIPAAGPFGGGRREVVQRLRAGQPLPRLHMKDSQRCRMWSGSVCTHFYCTRSNERNETCHHDLQQPHDYLILISTPDGNWLFHWLIATTRTLALKASYLPTN